MHEPIIIEIAEGNGLWSDKVSEAMKKLQAYVKKEWLILPSNTQLVETWVKNANECTETGEDQHFLSMLALCQSTHVFDIKYKANREAEVRELKRKKYFTKGKIGNRIDNRTGERESGKQLVEKVRWGNYSRSAIKKIVEYSKTVDEHHYSQPGSWKQIKKQLTNSEE